MADKPEIIKPRGMGHAYTLMSSGNILAAKKEEERIKAKIDKQSTETVPLFSMEFYIHSATDIIKRNGKQSLEDWNDIATSKSQITGRSPIEERIKNHEVTPVTMFNLSKHFGLYEKDEDYTKEIKDTVNHLEQEHDISYAMVNFQKEIKKDNPLAKIYFDMKEKGIEAHFSHNPDIAQKEKGHYSFYIYTPNVYQADHERMKFVKYLVDGGYVSMEQVKAAEGFSEHLLKHLSEHSYLNTKISMDSIIEGTTQSYLKQLQKERAKERQEIFKSKTEKGSEKGTERT